MCLQGGDVLALGKGRAYVCTMEDAELRTADDRHILNETI